MWALLGAVALVLVGGVLIFAALCYGAAVIQSGQDAERDGDWHR